MFYAVIFTSLSPAIRGHVMTAIEYLRIAFFKENLNYSEMTYEWPLKRVIGCVLDNILIDLDPSCTP